MIRRQLCGLEEAPAEDQLTWKTDLGWRWPWRRFLREGSREVANHSSVLAWRIPGREEPGGLRSIASQTVKPNWVTEYAGIIACEVSGGDRTGEEGKLSYDAAPAGASANPTGSLGAEWPFQVVFMEARVYFSSPVIRSRCHLAGPFLSWGSLVRLGARPTDILSWGWLTRPAHSQQTGNQGLRPKENLGDAPSEFITCHHPNSPAHQPQDRCS